MRLNKILMLVLSGCGIFAPIALTSCNTNDSNSNLPSNTIAIPFYDELYDTFNDEVYIRLTEDSTRSSYEVQDINKWYQEELNNNREYKWEKRC